MDFRNRLQRHALIISPYPSSRAGCSGQGYAENSGGNRMTQRVYVLEYHAKCGEGWASALVSVHFSLAGARAKLDAEGYDRGQAMTWTPEHTKHLNRWRGTFQGESYAYTITEVELTN